MGLLEDLTAKPVGPTVTARLSPDHLTSELVMTGNTLVATLPGLANEGTANSYLEEEGQDPAAWECTGFRKIKYGAGLESVRFTYKRATLMPERPPIDELIAAIEDHSPLGQRDRGTHGYIVGIGDMQFGKIDGDGVEGTLKRTIDNLNLAADAYQSHVRNGVDIGHIHIGWLGDHIEGFVSQGGANVWRTPLTLNEQIRLTRRVMLHAMTTFAPLTSRLTMAAIPGNHGESVRFSGKGITRYDDSHDTESLIAVSDAAALNPGAYGHVEFYVPTTDEMTVVLDVAGTRVGHVHGHQFTTNKHWDWWKGQAFGKSGMESVDLMMAGHLHHFHAQEKGDRLFIQVPALESESTWWRHRTGDTGNPGVVAMLTKDGATNRIEIVR